MKHLKHTFLILAILIITGCSPANNQMTEEGIDTITNLPEIVEDLGYGYTRRSDEKIYYKDKIAFFKFYEDSEESIFPDYESFEIVGESSGWYELVTKDKEHVYLDSRIIAEADPETLEILPLYYMRDKNYLYNPSGMIMENANPEDFKVIIHAGNVVITNGGVVEGADLETFHALSDGYFKDKNNAYQKYYYECWDKCPAMKIEDSDAESFEVFDDHLAKDRSHVYAFGNRVEDADPETFEVIYKSEAILGKTQRPVYAKDKNHVYKLSEGREITFRIMQGEDPETFEVSNFN